MNLYKKPEIKIAVLSIENVLTTSTAGVSNELLAIARLDEKGVQANVTTRIFSDVISVSEQ